MVKGTFFTYPPFLNNRQFWLDDSLFNRDNCLYCFYLLKKKFQEKGISLSTQDINKPDESDFVIFLEMPKMNNVLPDKNNYLIIYESPLIKPENWQMEKHQAFRKIFTWADNLIDNKKYFKINYSFKIPENLDFIISQKEKFCALIVGHKLKNHPQELYRERIKAIRWFEKNHPEEFDLYGTGWDRHYFQEPFIKLNRVKFLTKLLKPHHSSYKGIIVSKKEVLPKYKFSLAYENIKDITGYITEKIFDSFFNGTIPIYLGAPNITEHVPENTFIDKRKFANYEQLYTRLKNMSDSEYSCYLENIKNFLKSPAVRQFTAQYFAETISQEIIKDFSS